MSDMGFEDMTDEDLADPVEREQLDSLKQIAETLAYVARGMEALAQQQAQILAVLGAPRLTEAVGRDGRKLQAVSRIVNG